ncbi:hypothetical protein PsorP6_017702 [Peronosclerospora sorghi]|uniref:Uncharacterized protein n=1 Tax=Peronosclerospora sorghi TaxID=230839 RepID=A0ACC0WNT8_9STRA|nr:hypothetical protein PsorP6_017702 [Peronosclerospora sorghi]
MDLVSRWKEMTTVNLELKHEDTAALREEERKRIESIQLVHPPPFLRVPQVTAPWHFHFPIADQVDPPKPSNDVQHVRKRTRWLCVHRTDAVSQVKKLESE